MTAGVEPNGGQSSYGLFPFPEGWYFVTSRRELKKNSNLIRRTWLGEQIVAWADEMGGICVANAFCPHLGSDLGPEAGGRVREGCLVCPFHGYQFDIAGQCVATPWAPAPENAKLKTFPSHEIQGLIFAWYGFGGRPPQWSLPEGPEHGPDWSGMEMARVRFCGHPQETTENSVDLGHLRYVHGYDNVKRLGKVQVDGARFESRWEFTRPQILAGKKVFIYDVTALASIFGLGYSYVEVHERSIGLKSRFWVLATPVDGKVVEMTLVNRLQKMTRPKRPIVGLRFLPLDLRTRIMNRIIVLSQKHDVMQDVVVWSRKRYEENPALCRSDGEIGKFRHYCRQFYPQAPQRH